MSGQLNPSHPRSLNLISDQRKNEQNGWAQHLDEVLVQGWEGRNFDSDNLVLTRADPRLAHFAACVRDRCPRRAQDDGLCSVCADELQVSPLPREEFLGVPAKEDVCRTATCGETAQAEAFHQRCQSMKSHPDQSWEDRRLCVSSECGQVRAVEDESLCDEHLTIVRTWAVRTDRANLPWWQQVSGWLEAGGAPSAGQSPDVVCFGQLPMPLAVEFAAAARSEDLAKRYSFHVSLWRSIVAGVQEAGLTTAVDIGEHQMPVSRAARAMAERARRWINEQHDTWSGQRAQQDLIHLQSLDYSGNKRRGPDAKVDLSEIAATELREPLRAWILSSRHQAMCHDVYASVAITAIADDVLREVPKASWSGQHMAEIVARVRRQWTSQARQQLHLRALDQVIAHARRSHKSLWSAVPSDFVRDPDHDPRHRAEGSTEGGKRRDESFRYVPAPVMNHLLSHLHLLRLPTSQLVHKLVGDEFSSMLGRVLIAVSYLAGRRPIETVQLRSDCIKRDRTGDPYLEWTRRKLTKQSPDDPPELRRLPVGAEMVQIIDDWLEYLLDHGVRSQWLFPNLNNQEDDTHIRAEIVRETLRGREMEDRGLLRQVPPLPGPVEGTSGALIRFDLTTIDAYCFRHSFAQRCADAYVFDATGNKHETVPPRVLMEWMDHRSYGTTMSYYNVSWRRQKEALAGMPDAPPFDIFGHQQPRIAPERHDYARAKPGPSGGLCTEPSFVAGHRCPTGEDCELCPQWRVHPAERHYILERQRDLRVKLERSKALRAPEGKLHCLQDGIKHCQIMLDAIDRHIASLDEDTALAIEKSAAAQERLQDQYRLTPVNLKDWIKEPAA